MELRIHAREQVPHVWMVDPVAQTLEPFRLDGATYRFMASHEGDVSVALEPFEAIEIELSALCGKRT